MTKFTKLVQSTVARSRQSTPLDKEKLSIEELQLLKIRDECYEMVNTSSFFSGAVAAVPIPGMDIATDVSILMNLLPKINKKFGLSAEQVEALDPQLKQMTLMSGTPL